MIVKILIAVLIFGITVIIHELGHFLLAKANGITVTEFSIGFGPTVVKTEKGGTVYSLTREVPRRASQKWQTVRRRQRQAWKWEISSLPMREDIFPSEKS